MQRYDIRYYIYRMRDLMNLIINFVNKKQIDSMDLLIDTDNVVID